MRRRSVAKLRALILVVAGALALGGVAPVAATAATTPVIEWAHSTPDDYGIIEIYANAEAGIESLTARIRSQATGEELTSISSFSLSSGTAQNGVFTADTRVQLDKLDLYRIDVEAVDTLGQRTSRTSAGVLLYIIDPRFSPLSFDHTTITLARRTVQVRGTLSGRWPTDGLVRPISGMPVEVHAAVEPTATVQTRADGRFSAEMTLNDEGNISAYFNPRTTGYGFTESESQHISVTPQPTRLTVKVAPRQVKAGEPVTITGQLTWKSPDGWQPLANRRLGVSECRESNECPIMLEERPLTDADGRFTVTATPFATGYYSVGYSGINEDGSPNPFMGSVVSKASMSVLQPAEFTDFYAARDESGQVVVSGHLSFSNFTPVVAPVQIQYRSPGTAISWVTVADIANASGADFSATVDQPAAGQWRAYYPGEAKWFQTAVSAKVQVAAATP